MSAPDCKVVHSSALDIQICLSDNTKTYTSLDHIAGAVIVGASADTPFSELDIELLGIIKTSLRAPAGFTATPGRKETYERILELAQPDVAPIRRSERNFRAGYRYVIPFDFTVPEYIPNANCCHKDDRAEVREHHLRLPPTVEDIDDQSTSTSASSRVAVRYRVVARIWQAVEGGGDPRRKLITLTSEQVQLIPSAPARPPLPDHALKRFVSYRETKMSRNPLVDAGRVIISTAEPSPLQLRFPHDPGTDAGSTLLHIMLQFTAPGILNRPPSVGQLKLKVEVETYAGSYTCDPNSTSTSLSKIFFRTIPVSSQEVTDVIWTNHWSDMKDTSFHTAEFMAGVILPYDKDIVPTFETCLVGRRYRLVADLQVCRAGVVKTVTLQVPLQLSMGSSTRRNSLHGFASEAMPDLLDQHDRTEMHGGTGSQSSRERSMTMESLLNTDQPPQYGAQNYWVTSGRRDRRPFR